LDEEHTPQELRFQAIASAPVTATSAAAARNDQKAAAYEYSDALMFASRPAAEGSRIQCRIIRDRGGLYLLKLEKPSRGGVTMVDLLAARKRKKAKSSYYIISTSAEHLSRDDPKFAAKLRANFVGTNFTIYDNGVSPSKADDEEASGTHLREELGAIIYEANVLGFKGPRKMTVLLPLVDEKTKDRVKITPQNEEDGLLQRYKDKNLETFMVLQNKKPIWNEETSSYVLDFRGRVTQASVKNFQLVHESDENYIIMQFGRVGENEFTMDYQYPMSALQAFAVALSSFDGKLAVE